LGHNAIVWETQLEHVPEQAMLFAEVGEATG
jgi:hypothetical protein